MSSFGPDAEYDVIVVGGGINGLTAATYLQKSGLQGRMLRAQARSGRRLLHRGGDASGRQGEPLRLQPDHALVARLRGPRAREVRPRDADLQRVGNVPPVQGPKRGDVQLLQRSKAVRALAEHQRPRRRDLQDRLQLLRADARPRPPWDSSSLQATQGPEEIGGPRRHDSTSCASIIPEIPRKRPRARRHRAREAVYQDEKIRTA